jgi:lipoprotein-releasing system ATP-binding protein
MSVQARTDQPSSKSPAPSVILQAEGLVKDYKMGRRTVRVLHGVSLDVHRGELLSIVGPSGAGKSTLLHLLGLLDTPNQGRVLHEGQDLAELGPREQAAWRNRTVGFVFQFYHLLPDFSALENVALPSMVDVGVPALGRRRRIREQARRMLELVHLGERATHRPGQLSGGERQRVAIARALVNEPELLLCDEPTGNLDTDTGATILELLHEIRDKTGHTLVMVTHDEQVAARGDRVVHIVDGRVEQQ